MNAGVRQGDPLSPLLFNLAIDPLLNTLEAVGKGFSAAGVKLTTLAFADDLVLLSDSWAGMQTNLKILDVFCSLTGLAVHAWKCFGFLLTPNRGRWSVKLEFNNCQPWAVGDGQVAKERCATSGFM